LYREQYCPERPQTHTHEFVASTRLAEQGDERHNHRFAGVTSQAIRVPGGHIHLVKTNTDFFEEHFHEVEVKTELQIEVGEGKHIHPVMGRTSFNDGHKHGFFFATLIEDPLTKEKAH
jgi:hypothetical protein